MIARFAVRRGRASRCALLCCACLATAASARGASPIFGGPTYDPATLTGLWNPSNYWPSGTVAPGVGTTSVERLVNDVSRGLRAFRWDASGAPAVELGGLGVDAAGYTSTDVRAISPSGTTVGAALKFVGGVARGNRAVRWAPRSTVATELGGLGTDGEGNADALANAINPAGLAVGTASKYLDGVDLGSRAVRWPARSTAAVELGHLGTDSHGFTQATAMAVNAAGTAVGFESHRSDDGVFNSRAVRWGAGSTVATELDGIGANPVGSSESYAFAANASGAAAGYGEKYVGEGDLGTRAIRWAANGTAATELGTLGTDDYGGTYVYGWAMNDAGTVVGIAQEYVDGSNVGSRAVRWDAGSTKATVLGNFGTDAAGYAYGRAVAINFDGVAVGYVERYADGVYDGDRAVAWGTDGAAFDLNALLSPEDAAHWTLIDANAVTDDLWITGIGMYDVDGAAGPLKPYSRAFLIQAPKAAVARRR